MYQNTHDFAPIGGAAKTIAPDLPGPEQVFRLPDPGYALDEVERRYADQAEAIDRSDGLAMRFADWRLFLRRCPHDAVLRLSVATSRGHEVLARRQAELSGLLASC